MNNRPCTDAAVGEMLHAYELGLLEDGEKSQFEIHLLGCEHCIEQMQRLQSHVSLLRRDRLVSDTVAIEASEEPAGRNVFSRIRSLFWSPAEFSLRPVYAAAAAILLLVAGIMVSRFISSRDIASVQTVTLEPSRGDTSQAFFVKSMARDGLISFIVEDARPEQTFEIILTDGGNRLVTHITDYDGIDDHGIGRLLLPSDAMTPGLYYLRVICRSDNGADTLHYNPLRIVE